MISEPMRCSSIFNYFVGTRRTIPADADWSRYITGAFVTFRNFYGILITAVVSLNTIGYS
jgi:hypothetical protein